MNPERLHEAERAVLSDMLAPGIAEKRIHELTPEDFFEPVHQRVFTAIQAAYIQRRPLNEITVSAEIAHLYGDSETDAIIALTDARAKYAFTKGLTVGENIRVVREASKRRQTFSLLQEAEKSIVDETREPADTIETLRLKLKAIDDNDKAADIIPLPDVLIKAYCNIEDIATGKTRGISYGIPSLDTATGGLHKGEMTIIGARPGVGKSALAMEIALAATKAGKRVLICSREMTAEQYGIRILLRGTNKPAGIKLRAGRVDNSDWDDLADTLQQYAAYDNAAFTFRLRYIEDLRAVVESEASGKGLDVLIVDYTQLMQTRQRFEQEYQRIGYISKQLKDISTDCNVAVLALAQVGRSADGDMPTMAELRGSGDLEQDADNIIFMHRPKDASDKWINPNDRQAFEGWGMQGLQYICLHIAKQRQGETQQTNLLFNPSHMTYSGITRDEPS